MARRSSRASRVARGIVILYHVSPHYNDKMIARIGLDPMRSKGKQRVVWGCKSALIPWALAHVAKNHGVDWRQLTIWRMEVPRYGLQRRRRGIWIDIRGECIPVVQVSWPNETGLPMPIGCNNGNTR